MNPPLHQVSLPIIIGVAAVIFAALFFVQRWALQRLNADPADDMDSSTGDKDAEILGNVPVRSKVGTPRPRRLQPVGEEEPAPAGGMLPADSLALAGSSAFAKPTTEASGTGKPAPFGAEGAPASPFTPPASKPAEPAAAAPAADKPREAVALPPLAVGIPPLSTGSVTKEATPTAKPADTKTPPVGPTLEKVADGLVAIGQPVPLATGSAGSQTPPAVETDDDVKKRKSSSTDTGSKPGDAGLVITPKAGDVVAETVKSTDTPAAPKPESSVAPAMPPSAAAPGDTKTEPAAKITGRPRIFLPANLPASTAKPADEPAPTPVGKTEVKTENKDTPPAVEAKPEVKSEAKPEIKPEEKPADKPAAVIIPAPVVVEPTPAKVETPAPVAPSALVEPAKSETSAAPASGWLRGLLRRADADEPAKTTPPAAPEPAAKVETPAAPTPVPAPIVVETKPAPTPETALTAIPAPESKSIPTEPPPVDKPIQPRPAEPAPVAKPPAVSVSPSLPTMAQTDTTTNVPNESRASAQLTLGFEVASLQLTPFFKLGGMQLKPLSKVVGLHLVATQSADNPLAAGISFEIEKVELNESSHIKSIVLKPLGDSQDAAIPQSKLQVENIQVGQGGDGAPISVTSSGAAVQLLATCSIAAMEFTPSFEIGSLRLEPTSNSVLLRLSASSKPASLDLPPAFEVASVQLTEDGQITTMRLTPGSKPA